MYTRYSRKLIFTFPNLSIKFLKVLVLLKPKKSTFSTLEKKPQLQRDSHTYNRIEKKYQVNFVVVFFFLFFFFN